MSLENIREKLIEDPELSNRAIAQELGINDKPVGTVRRELEDAGEIPRVERVRGVDGKLRRVQQSRQNGTGGGGSSPLETDDALPLLRARYGTPRQVLPRNSVLGLIRVAVRSHPLAFLVALPFGGFVPVSVWCLTHLETLELWHWAMVAGGALFSSLTVIQWGERILDNLFKAIGFAVLVEGVMITSQTEWLSFFALGLLVVINSIACAVALTEDDLA